MHVHVLGAGAVGTLVAVHMRAAVRQRLGVAGRVRGSGATAARILPLPPHLAPYVPDATSTRITLHLRERRNETRHALEATVERDGARMMEGPFDVEWASALDPQGAAASDDPIDSLIVTTKADATYSAIRRLAPRITPSTTIVLLQNGMGVLDMLLERLWQDRAERPNLVLATTTHGCYLRRMLHTVHAGFGSLYLGTVPSARGGARGFERACEGRSSGDPLQPELDLGAVPDEPATRSLRATLALLLSLPLDVHWEPIRVFQLRALRKLIINACVNPTTALVDCKNGDLFGAPSALELFRALCTEASQVLEAHARDAKAAGANESDAAHLSSLPLADLLTQTDADGLPLLDASLQPASMLHEVENVVRATAANWSSMHQDVKNRRGSTEIDYMNGYLAELGRAYGIPTPAHDLMTNLVKLKTQRATGSWKTGHM